jgi:hypothetical protein
MADVVLVATIVVFFLLVALLVRALDRMIDASGGDADLYTDPGAGPDGEVPGTQSRPGRPA